MSVSNYLVTDDLTVILGLAAAGLFLLHNLYKPQSLVHPILLGRQSDVSRVRNPKESAIYRNYSTGMMGRFPLRPAKELYLLKELLRPELDGPRTLWSTKITNPELQKRVTAFGTGLVKQAGLVPRDSNVLLLLNDGLEFLIADMALSSNSIPSLTLTSSSLLSQVFDEYSPTAIITHADFLPQLLELVYDANEASNHTIIVVGQPNAKLVRQLAQVRILQWDDIERQGAQLEPVEVPTPDVFTVSFYTASSGKLRGAELTHQNVTAGVAAIRALFPTSGALSSLDTIISSHSLSTPYGRAVAYTAIFEGASFATVASSNVIGSGAGAARDLSDLKTTERYPIPSPTVLFIHPSHLTAITQAITQKAKSSGLLYSVAWRQKMANVLEGFLTKQSLWDRLVFDPARASVLGNGAGTVRAVIIAGGSLESQTVTPSRIALSTPLVNAYIHPQVAGPVLASHPLDLQTFPTEASSAAASAADTYAFTYLAPVGSPAINVEAKLTGVDDNTIESGGDPVGSLWIRGPSVGTLLDVKEAEGEAKGWVEAGETARVLSNGTFKVTPSKQ
ncbi:acetyl-CoA synthetase-like protein [Irpex rosettiformis]|uniref:Acetyl-CoA synthetase-like protein n=1 Tax=Irpex rosettiformis TaxID=378272 RepID=A0ACB8TWI1_9APHY|nr:acetyl-CoA synthetase-like protein [Irpex rosettiformis]